MLFQSQIVIINDLVKSLHSESVKEESADTIRQTYHLLLPYTDRETNMIYQRYNNPWSDNCVFNRRITAPLFLWYSP